MKPPSHRAKPALGLACAACLLATLACGAGKPAKAASAPRVVVATPAESADPGRFAAVEAAARDYPAATAEIVHAVLPPGGGEAAIAAFVAKAAQDRRVKVLVVAPAPRGTAEGFRRAKAARPELFCLAADPRDEALPIESSADLVVQLDREGRAYAIAWAAKRMGAKALVAAYAREEASDPDALRERKVMSRSAASLGLPYSAELAPSGVDPAAYVRARSGAWLSGGAALYCAQAALVAPLLAGAIAGNGIVAEAAGETTRSACAAALGVDLSPALGDAAKEKRILETAAKAAGMSGRLGLWDASYSRASAAGLAEYAARLASGKARKDDQGDLAASLDARSGGSAWILRPYADPETGVKSANRVLLSQDIYVLGRGYLQNALVNVPSDCLRP
jgi:hypothetical protein